MNKKHLILLMLTYLSPADAATSHWIGPGSDFNTAANWDAGVPSGGSNFAGFATALPTVISMSAGSTFGGWVFDPGAAAYTINVPTSDLLINFNGGPGNGITNNSSQTQTLVNNGSVLCYTFTGNNIAIINHGSFDMRDSAGNATITNSGQFIFGETSTGANALILNTGTLELRNTATLGNATVINNGILDARQLTTLPPNWSAGSIDGTGVIHLGATRLTVGSNNLSTTISGNIDGTSGGLTKVGNGILTLAGTNDYLSDTNVSAGTLVILGSVSHAVNVNPGAMLAGNGSVGDVTNNGVVSPGVSAAGVLTTANFSGTGHLNIHFNGPIHEQLHAQNADISGQTLDLTGPNFAVGRYTLVTANALTGPFIATNLPASPLNFLIRYTLTEAALAVSFPTVFSNFAQTTNQRYLSLNLEEAKNSSTAEFTNSVLTLSQLPAAQIPEAYNQIGGDSLASFQQVSLQNAALFTKGMRQHSVDLSSSVIGLWGQGLQFIDTMKGDPGVGSPASHATTRGFQAGFDYPISDNLLFGFAGGYADTSLDIVDRASSGGTKSVHSGIYGRYTQDGWFTNASLGLLSESNEMRRTINFGGLNERPQANFNSRLYTTFLEEGYILNQSPLLSIVPSVSVRETYLTQAGFTESEAPGLDLTVADRSVNSYISSLGTGLAYSFRRESVHPLFLNGHLAWEHEWANRNELLTAHFNETSGGSDFTVEGTPRSRDTAVIGLEGHVPVRTNLNVFIDYTAALNSTQTLQKMLGGITFTW